MVVNFLGADPEGIRHPNVFAARTLEDAAAAAVALADGRRPEEGRPERPPFAMPPSWSPGSNTFAVCTAGTFCYEASLLLKKTLGQVYSNTPVDSGDRLDDVWTSRGHTVIDLGDDLFTRGRPHPMIDHRLRNERILKEAGDPKVAVIPVGCGARIWFSSRSG